MELFFRDITLFTPDPFWGIIGKGSRPRIFDKRQFLEPEPSAALRISPRVLDAARTAQVSSLRLYRERFRFRSRAAIRLGSAFPLRSGEAHHPLFCRKFPCATRLCIGLAHYSALPRKPVDKNDLSRRRLLEVMGGGGDYSRAVLGSQFSVLSARLAAPGNSYKLQATRPDESFSENALQRHGLAKHSRGPSTRAFALAQDDRLKKYAPKNYTTCPGASWITRLRTCPIESMNQCSDDSMTQSA